MFGHGRPYVRGSSHLARDRIEHSGGSSFAKNPITLTAGICQAEPRRSGSTPWLHLGCSLSRAQVRPQNPFHRKKDQSQLAADLSQTKPIRLLFAPCSQAYDMGASAVGANPIYFGSDQSGRQSSLSLQPCAHAHHSVWPRPCGAFSAQRL